MIGIAATYVPEEMPRSTRSPSDWKTDREAISRHLKAARWIAGTGYRTAKGQLAPLPANELAGRPTLVGNGITASRIEEIEQMQVDARIMELEQIALALEHPRDYFAAADDDVSPERLRLAAELLGPQLLAAAREVLRARESAPPETDGRDHPPAIGGGGAG